MTKVERQTPEYRQALRADLLALAGIDTQEQSKGIARAWKRLNRHLYSRKVELVTRDGYYVRVVVPDNQSQLRAAEAILHMTGANAYKQESQAGDMTINIVFPHACQPTQAIDVTPLQVVDQGQNAQREEASGD